MNSVESECAACGGTEVYVTRTNASGGYGPTLLPGLGRLFGPARVEVRVCSSCGHVALFADGETRARLSGAGRWKRAR